MRSCCFLIAVLVMFLFSNIAFSDDDIPVDPDWSKQINAPYTKKGADRCLKCHDEDNEYPIMPIFKSKHGKADDARSPMAGLQCEACHGPGGNHAKKSRRGKQKAPILSFKEKNNAPNKVQNDMCLQCHKTHARIGWEGSSHQLNDLACVDCHTLHVAKDPLLIKEEQPTVCFKCHQKKRSEFHRKSNHPVRFGEMKCTNCHNTHDAMGENLIDAPNKNEKCYECHAEKRGPFLWEHAPVFEDCTICHTPHGSNYQALLKKAPPHLCQQCHAQQNGHAESIYGKQALNSKSKFMVGKGCLNCHSVIHGSNHPSGVKLMR